MHKYCLPLLLLTLESCALFEKPRVLTLVEDDSRITGIDIPATLLHGVDYSAITVSLKGTATPVLGEFVEVGKDVRFSAHVPLTRGMTYVVRSDRGDIGEVIVPESEAELPRLLEFYPKGDTVPENLLKCYLKFSQPMSEGHAYEYIHLINLKGDTMKGTFLYLEPELWNEDQTVLTLWFDPGRIKLDLIPNKEFGNPLKKGETYRLEVSGGWKSKEGKPLYAAQTKTLYVVGRDETSPEPDTWRIDFEEETSEIILDFHEPLDHELILNAISIVNGRGDIVAGDLTTNYADHAVRFTPAGAWIPGKYTIRIESRLEDLAGNNLNRLFEVDLSKQHKNRREKTTYERTFEIE